jgi:ABC-type amino acid transport system permease subunit
VGYAAGAQTCARPLWVHRNGTIRPAHVLRRVLIPHRFRVQVPELSRAYIGLVYTAQLLHPAVFRDMHPREMLNDYEQQYVSGTNKTMVIYP